MKIQSSELRIGNYVYVCNKYNGVILPENNSYSRIFTIEFDGAKVVKDISKTFAEQIYFKYSYLSIEPIPLTEEILLKCGFVKLKPQFSLSVGGESLIYYLHEESGFLIWYHGEKLGYSLQQVIKNIINPECTCFNTVHELQNIFYWNKKKQELEIKL